jgi:hypothetical protein
VEQEMPMNGANDFWTGPHHFWTHFWCGLIFGAGLGAWIGCQVFDSGWRIFATLVVVALVVAYSGGRWGDRFWQWLIGNLWWFT